MSKLNMGFQWKYVINWTSIVEQLIFKQQY